MRKYAECADRHISCRQWQIDGHCHGKSKLFMQENCRASCGICRTPKDDDCLRHSTPNSIGQTFKPHKLQRLKRSFDRRRKCSGCEAA
uniref:ShKT domain-containing protein n=1 Tax=Parascaris univalens TaxID=6257 RepID=A0A915A8M3_PARUN